MKMKFYSTISNELYSPEFLKSHDFISQVDFKINRLIFNITNIY